MGGLISAEQGRQNTKIVHIFINLSYNTISSNKINTDSIHRY